MKLTPIYITDLCVYPSEFRSLLSGAKLYDSSCSPEAKVIFIDKDGGYFLKSAPKGTLEREAAMTQYFYGKGLSANVLAFIKDEYDWLLTEKIHGDDCTAEKYLDNPERLCDTLAERLAMLHATDYIGCPVTNHTERYLSKAAQNKMRGSYDTNLFTDNWGYRSAEEAWSVVEEHGHLLQADTLLHGDYCLPNIILDDWAFNGFIDLDSGGVGDRHVDLFWATWTLFFNLKTDKYRQRFIDVYGRDRVDKDMLRLVSAIEVFG